MIDIDNDPYQSHRIEESVDLDLDLDQYIIHGFFISRANESLTIVTATGMKIKMHNTISMPLAAIPAIEKGFPVAHSGKKEGTDSSPFMIFL